MTQGQFAMVGAMGESPSNPRRSTPGKNAGISAAARKASVSVQTMTKAFLVRDYAIAGAGR